MEEGQIKKILASMKCGICGQKYEGTNIKILGHRDELWFLSVFCQSCCSQGLVAAVVKEGRETEFITDLKPEEIQRFKDKDGIQADDVLDVHQFLKTFNGDIASLFSAKN